MDALSLWCVYQNTLANAAPRAMARWRVTLALWVRLEASNARSLQSLSSNGIPDHPLPLDLVCRRDPQVCVRGIGVAHSAADTDGPAKRHGIVEDGPALRDALLGLGRPDPPLSIGVVTVDASLRRRFRGGRPCGSLNHVGPVQLGMVTVSLLYQNVHRCQAQCRPFACEKCAQKHSC